MSCFYYKCQIKRIVVVVCFLLSFWCENAVLFVAGLVVPIATNFFLSVPQGHREKCFLSVETKKCFRIVSVKSTADNLDQDYRNDEVKSHSYSSPNRKARQPKPRQELGEASNLNVVFDNMYNESINQFRSDKDILLSYAYSIQRIRKRMVKKYSQLRDENKIVLPEYELSMIPKEDFIKPSRSLLGYLSNNFVTYESDENLTDLVKVLNRAVVQAIRSATSVNDYKLVIQLVMAVQIYAKPLSRRIFIGPRIVGEAVGGLLKTSANIGKIRSLWNAAFRVSASGKYMERTAYGTPTSQEVNAMINAYVHHKKIRAAINFFHEHENVVDSYSISIILQSLADSIKIRHSDGEFNERRYIQPKKMTESTLPTLSNELLLPWLSNITWQWNEAIRLIDLGLTRDKAYSIHLLNNPVMSSLLKLNNRITTEVGPENHDSPAYSLRILRLMRDINISPDEMTYATVIANLGKRWNIALKLLRCSQQQSVQGLFDDSTPNSKAWRKTWILPRPNNHIYSATIAIAANAKQYIVARQLLNDVRANHYGDDVQQTTWMYNLVLKSLVGREDRGEIKVLRKQLDEATKKRKASGSRKTNINSMTRAIAIASQNQLTNVFSVLYWMERCSLPTVQADTVTFNTILSALAHSSSYLESKNWAGYYRMWCSCMALSTSVEIIDDSLWKDHLLDSIISQMIKRNVPRDITTYRHAFKLMIGSNEDSILKLLSHSISEVSVKNKDHHNDARNKVMSLYYECLYCMVASGNVAGAMAVISEIPFERSTIPSNIITQILEVLRNGNKTNEIPLFLLALTPDTEAINVFAERNVVEIDPRLFEGTDRINPHHFAKAISSCLSKDDFKSAQRILILMQQKGIRPNDATMEEIALKYASGALVKFPYHTRTHRTDGIVGVRFTTDRNTSLVAAQSSASRAHSIICNLAMKDSATTKAIAEVTKVCGLVELWQESRQLLGIILSHYADEKSISGEKANALHDLRSTLLRVCANTGNLTHALHLCDDIQTFSSRNSSRNESAEGQNGNKRHGTYKNVLSTIRANEWKSVLVTAAKCSNWHVCLTTLQCLRPFVEDTHPSKAANAAQRMHLARQYTDLQLCLTTAVKCLAIHGHYAWIVRTIEDWIEWSGRRPPREVILTAIRLLSLRGKGGQATSLLLRCVEIPPTAMKSGEHIENLLLFIGAITALHRGGLYDAADDAFVAAMSRGVLELKLRREFQYGLNRIVLDLHGLNIAVARAAVRISLQQEYLTNRHPDFPIGQDVTFMIVTGRGLNSAIRMRPVLRPEVQRMLLEEFYPPMSTMSVPGNMGALIISSNDVAMWLEHQFNQRSARLLTVASIIQSYGDHIRMGLSKTKSYFDSTDNT